MKHVFGFLFLSFSHCAIKPQESATAENEWLVFGIQYGECIENCAFVYKIAGDNLYKATETLYSSEPLERDLSFDTPALAKEKFEMVKHLLGEFPDTLWSGQHQVFGMPDSHDQGGIILEKKAKGLAKRWYIDPDTSNIPRYLRSYTDHIEKAIHQLR
jgi:hypothetical protein